MGSRLGAWRSPQMGPSEPDDFKVNGAMNRFAACPRFPRSRFRRVNRRRVRSTQDDPAGNDPIVGERCC